MVQKKLLEVGKGRILGVEITGRRLPEGGYNDRNLWRDRILMEVASDFCIHKATYKKK